MLYVESDDTPTPSDRPMPTENGWYMYSSGPQGMIFLLRDALVSFDPESSGTVYKKQWSVHLDNGEVSDCEWGYIDQALGVWDLVKIELPVGD